MIKLIAYLNAILLVKWARKTHTDKEFHKCIMIPDYYYYNVLAKRRQMADTLYFAPKPIRTEHRRHNIKRKTKAQPKRTQKKKKKKKYYFTIFLIRLSQTQTKWNDNGGGGGNGSHTPFGTVTVAGYWFHSIGECQGTFQSGLMPPQATKHSPVNPLGPAISEKTAASHIV